MGFHCPVLSEEYIGADSAVLCRKAIAKRKGIKCPRKEDQYTVHESCFDLTRLTKKTRAETEAMFLPKSMAIAGDGEPDPVPDIPTQVLPETLSATITETKHPLQDSL